jgi:hypothetical protein
LGLDQRGHCRIDTYITNICGSSGRRARPIEHEDVNLTDPFSRFAEQSRCTIGGDQIATDTDSVRERGCHFLGAFA